MFVDVGLGLHVNEYCIFRGMQKSIKCVIIDDEFRARNVLRTLLSSYCDGVEVIAECSNLLDGVKVIKELGPDLVFLDVQMPEYYGYEIVHFFERFDFDIIFVTAHDQYALKAFELSALDFLLKPIDTNRLIESVQRVKEHKEKKDVFRTYKTLVESMQTGSIQKIVLPELGDRRVLETKSIVAMEADGSYCKIHLLEGESILVGKNLKYFTNQLSDHNDFFRSHRSWLINLRHVTQLHKSNLSVKLSNSLVTKIARNKLVLFEEKVA